MKFPNNTDAFAYHLGALAKCSDQRDAQIMLTALRYRTGVMSERRRCALAYIGLPKAPFSL